MLSAISVASASDVKDTIEDYNVSRPVISNYAIQIGGESVIDTYLSPLHYRGVKTALRGSWEKAFTPKPEKFSMMSEASVSFGNYLNPAKNRRMLSVFARYGWSMSRRYSVLPGLTLSAGGIVAAEAGVYYLSSNSNNPASVKADISIGAVGGAAYRIDLGKCPLVFTDRISIPVAGCFFTPQYGESYYEIYLGNRAGLAHFGWWGNNMKLTNFLNCNIDLGRTALSVGYCFEMMSCKANNLITNTRAHSVVIGVVPGGLRLRKPRSCPQEIITVMP